MATTSNPLRQFFRQPAIYISLPSKGNHWPAGSLDMPANSELPVYPMTALDEIAYRTPDALFNGQAVVGVIQSCMPNIRNAWQTPAVDLNAILVAIRIASYGHDMEFGTQCPACNTETDYTIDLRNILDGLHSADYSRAIRYGDLEIYLQPMSYLHQTETNKMQFEQQKRIQLIQTNGELTEEQKIEELNKSLMVITKLTTDALKWSVSAIRTPSALVTEPEFVSEFLDNCDRKLFEAIKRQIIELREGSEVKPLQIKCSECGHEYQQLLTMDQASFFEDAS
jgi:bacterioferritin-associated ferredoxin